LTNNSYDFTGRYEGEIDGIKALLQLNQDSNDLQGDLNKNGVVFSVVGVVTDDKIEGRLSDADNMQSYMLQAEINNSFLIIHLITPDLTSGNMTTNSYTFKKVDRDTNKSDLSSKYLITDSEYDNDTDLIGTWAREEIIGSTEMAISTQVVIELDSEGNYKLLGAINLKGAKDTGYSGDTTKGKWRTHNGIFYMLVSGSKYWKPYARYNIEGNDKMTFILEDAERQDWVKRDD
jgi:hypothetical protein